MHVALSKRATIQSTQPPVFDGRWLDRPPDIDDHVFPPVTIGAIVILDLCSEQPLLRTDEPTRKVRMLWVGAKRETKIILAKRSSPATP
jgi:hypothetical protein